MNSAPSRLIMIVFLIELWGRQALRIDDHPVQHWNRAARPCSARPFLCWPIL
ncbi:hypothetical protein [Lysobacter gummosus]|uniref:hypothetical protein n=1 Tax=Lysobacter gummosus TaxID=262324 RepID=UPI00362B034C